MVELLDDDGRAGGVRCVDAETGERFEVEAANVVNATGVWADRIRPEEILDEAEVPRIAPSRGTHVTVSHASSCRSGNAACIVPAGADRTIFALPWYGRALIGTTDSDYDGDIAHVQPAPDDIDYLLDAVNAFFGTELGRADLTGAYAGVRPLISTGDPRKSVDISRQGRAVRDLVRAAHDHRRQAHHLAADGQAGRRPDGRARGPRGARVAPPRSRSGWPRRRADLEPPAGLTESDLPAGWRERLRSATGTAARNVLAARRRARPSSPRPIVDGQPDLLAEAVVAARSSRRAPSPTCSCGAPGWGCSPRPQLRDRRAPRAASRRRSAASWAGTTPGSRPRPSAGSPTPAAEGIDPASGAE